MAQAKTARKDSTHGGRIRVRQVRSVIGRSAQFRNIVAVLGLGRIGATKEYTLSPALQGMINKVAHIIEVEHLK